MRSGENLSITSILTLGRPFNLSILRLDSNMLSTILLIELSQHLHRTLGETKETMVFKHRAYKRVSAC